MEVRHETEANGTNNETHGVSQLGVLELGQQSSPYHRTHGLNGKENTGPVTCLLEGLARGIGGIPHHLSNRARGVVPHVKHGGPREELDETYLPESRRGVLEQSNPVGTLLLLLRNGIILGIVLRIPLTDLRSGIDNAEDENGGADVERPDDAIGHHTLLGHIADANKREHKGEHITHHRASIAEERLDTISLGLLLLIHHIAHQHLKRLHSHIDGCIEEHKGDEAEHHGGTDGETQRARVGQQTHDEHGHGGSDKQVRDTTTKACPCLIAQRSDDGLHQDTHQRGQDPEITQVVGIGTKGGEDTGDVGTLQRISDLHTEESKTQIP